MAAHLLRLNYETEAAVNIFHEVLHPQCTASICIIWPQSIFRKIKAQTVVHKNWRLWQLFNGGLMRRVVIVILTRINIALPLFHYFCMTKPNCFAGVHTVYNHSL